MWRMESIPEREISTATVLKGNGETLVLAKNGSKVALLIRNTKGWEKEYLWHKYQGKDAPVIASVGEKLGVFATLTAQPTLREISSPKSITLKSPYLKRAKVTGKTVFFKGNLLVPAMGVPYGCRLYSPVVFESAGSESSWHLASIVCITEDLEFMLDNPRLTVKEDEVYLFVETFPVRTILYTKSTDARTWEPLKSTGILGAHSTCVNHKGKLHIVCAQDETLCIFCPKEHLWMKKAAKSMEAPITYIDATSDGKVLTITVALKNGEGKIIELEV